MCTNSKTKDVKNFADNLIEAEGALWLILLLHKYKFSYLSVTTFFLDVRVEIAYLKKIIDQNFHWKAETEKNCDKPWRTIILVSEKRNIFCIISIALLAFTLLNKNRFRIASFEIHRSMCVLRSHQGHFGKSIGNDPRIGWFNYGPFWVSTIGMGNRECAKL